MTNFMKRENDLIAEFQKEMDDYGLEVSNSTGGMYVDDYFRMEMNTKPIPARGQKKLMDELKGLGYTVVLHRTLGKSYMSFTVRKFAKIERRPDDGDEYVEPQQETEAEAASDFNSRKEFAVRVIAKGDFLDSDPGYNGKVYQVETATIRLNPAALNEWILTRCNRTAQDFTTQDEYRAWQEERTAAMGKLRWKIAEAAGFREIEQGTEPSVEQIISEVFAVAYIHEYKGAE